MSINQLFDHKCDIYRLQESVESGTYGLPDSKTFGYTSTPVAVDQECHFKLSALSAGVTRTDPNKQVFQEGKLTFPLGTDVQNQDKVVNKETQVTYIVYFPKNLRGNHIVATIKTDMESL